MGLPNSSATRMIARDWLGRAAVQRGQTCRPPPSAEGELAAESLDPVFEADQSRAGAEASAAGAVVAGLNVEHVAGRLDLHRNGGCVGVLGRVGQCLGDHVVGADL